jgi:hypothetical protein
MSHALGTMKSFAATVGIVATVTACSPAAKSGRAPVAHDSSAAIARRSDPAFAAMQERGAMAMGVDQYTSTHTFEALPDGGRITLVRDTADTLGVRQIRAHLALIEHAFQAGDFSTPEFVHMRMMPGTAVMAQKRDVIAYAYRDLPGGGELRMTTRDSAAIAAIHEFMAAQRGEHHAGGMER